MSLYSVDVEADGPCPGLYSMVQVGAVKVTPALDSTFFSTLKPITEHWIDDALTACKLTREITLKYDDPQQAMIAFRDYVLASSVGRPVFISDNPGFDWQFVNYYFHYYLGENPFGFSSRRIGDIYSGLTQDWKGGAKFRKFRTFPHTHNALDDAKGNASAILGFAAKYNLAIDYV